jgi:hypothetical protein
MKVLEITKAIAFAILTLIVLPFVAATADGGAVSHSKTLLSIANDDCESVEETDGFVVVDNLDELRGYANASHMKIRMTPGVYLLNTASSRHFIEFTGSDNHWDMTGVTISASLDLFRKFSGRRRGSSGFYCVIDVTGDRNVMEGLTVMNHGEGYGDIGRNKHFNITGSDCLIRNVTSVTSGSNPWGYGSLFGIAGGEVRKMNGIRIGAPARNTRLIGCQVHMRAMGHAIFVQGAINTLIEDCHVDGLLRATNEILAETTGYAFERRFKVPGYGEGVQIGADRLVPSDEIVSLSEDGIRMYPNDDGVNTGSTIIKNCTVANMRRGICTGLSQAADRIINCKVQNCIAAGYNIGSNDELIGCSADAKYAEALCLHNQRSEGAHVELKILDSREKMANSLLAKINGSNHTVSFQTSDPAFVPKEMTIELASKNGYGSRHRGESRATGVTLNNQTAARVVLFPGATKNNIISQESETTQKESAGAGPLVLGQGVGRFKVGPLLARDDFEDLKKWVVQIQQQSGYAPADVAARDHTLDCLVPGRGCTMWFKQKLSTRVAITYDVLCPTQKPAINGVQPRDINNFWMATDPVDPNQGLFDSVRYTGAFSSYDKIHGYYASTGGGGTIANLTTRMRRYPREIDGNPAAHLALNDKDGQQGYLITPDKVMKVQLVAYDDVIQYIVDGKLNYEIAAGDRIHVERRDSEGNREMQEEVYDLDRFSVYQEGYFGLRMVGTHHIYTNFRVYALEPDDRVKPQAP